MPSKCSILRSYNNRKVHQQTESPPTVCATVREHFKRRNTELTRLKKVESKVTPDMTVNQFTALFKNEIFDCHDCKLKKTCGFYADVKTLLAAFRFKKPKSCNCIPPCRNCVCKKIPIQ